MASILQPTQTVMPSSASSVPNIATAEANATTGLYTNLAANGGNYTSTGVNPASVTTPPQPGSTLANLAGVPNTPANLPSSSASVVQGANAQSAVNSQSTAPTTTPDPNAAIVSNLAQAYSSQGINVTASQIQQWVDTGMDPQSAAAKAAEYVTNAQEKQTALQTQQSEYQAELAKNNASYAAANSQLDIQRQAAIHTGIAEAAKNGLFENGGSDATSYGAAIGRQYDNLQTQLDAKAEEAQAASDSGNDQAVAKINSDMATMLQNGLAQIATQAENSKVLAANDQAKATTAFQSALTTPSISSANAATLSSLPPNWAAMTPAQQQTAMGLTGGLMQMAQKTGSYTDPTTGQFSPALAWNAIQGGLTNSIKQQKATQAINTANLDNVLKQNKVLDQELETQASTGYVTNPAGSAFANAYSAIQGTGVKDSANPSTGLSTYGTIGKALTNGDTETAKNELTNIALQGAKKTNPEGVQLYQGLTTVNNYMDTLKADINKLPKSDQSNIINGTFEKVGQYFGSNPKGPAAAKVVEDVKLITGAYGKLMGGSRGLSPSEISYFSSVMPNYQDISSLNMTDIDAFRGIQSSIASDVIGGVIGQDNYDSIYGANTPGSTATSTASSAGSTGGAYDWQAAMDGFWNGFKTK